MKMRKKQIIFISTILVLSMLCPDMVMASQVSEVLGTTFLEMNPYVAGSSGATPSDAVLSEASPSEASPSDATPSDAIPSEATPAFIPEIPNEIPDWYKKVYGRRNSIYTFVDRNSVSRWRTYGYLNAEPFPSWYECDKTGKLYSSCAAVDVDNEYYELAPYVYRSVDPSEQEWENLFETLNSDNFDFEIASGSNARGLDQETENGFTDYSLWEKEIVDEYLGQNYDESYYDVWWLSENFDNWNVLPRYFFYGHILNLEDAENEWFECDEDGNIKSGFKNQHIKGSSFYMSGPHNEGGSMVFYFYGHYYKHGKVYGYWYNSEWNGSITDTRNNIVSWRWESNFSPSSATRPGEKVSKGKGVYRNPEVAESVEVELFETYLGDYSDDSDACLRVAINNPNPTATFFYLIFGFTYNSDGDGSSEAYTPIRVGDYALAYHNHYGDGITRVEPTCTSNGYVSGNCVACGSIYETLPALGHSMGDWYRSVNPTCTVVGYDKRDCGRGCGHYETSGVSALGHAWPESYNTTANNGTYFKDCTRCGNRLDTQNNPYIVRYNGNGSTDGLEAYTQNMKYSNAARLTNNRFERKYYTFTGWNRSPAGNGQAYVPGEVVNNMTPVYNATVDLYAQWNRTRSQVTFYDWDGTILQSEEVENNTAATPPAAPDTKTGYSFQKWNKDISSVKDHLDVTAIYYPNKYKIEFDSNNGSICASKTCTYDTKIGELPTSSRKGYTFKGWFTDLDGGTQVKESDMVPLGDVTYYAQWEINQYTAHFDGNGGSDGESITKNYKEAFGELPGSQREGHTFKGWYVATSSDAEEITEITEMPAEDVTYYAGWKINKYTADFDGNGGSDGKNIIKDYDEKLGTLPDSERIGYSFQGWYVATSSNADMISENNKMPAKDSVYYAHWKPNKYILYLNRLEGNRNSKIVIFDAPCGVLGYDRNPEDYIFAGWYRQKPTADIPAMALTGMNRPDKNSEVTPESIYQIPSASEVYSYFIVNFKDAGDNRNYRPGKDDTFDTEDDNYYFDAEDRIKGSLDDKKIHPGEDGIYGTEDDNYTNDDGYKVTPGEDNIFGTEDDIIHKPSTGGAGGGGEPHGGNGVDTEPLGKLDVLEPIVHVAIPGFKSVKSFKASSKFQIQQNDDREQEPIYFSDKNTVMNSSVIPKNIKENEIPMMGMATSKKGLFSVLKPLVLGGLLLLFLFVVYFLLVGKKRGRRGIEMKIIEKRDSVSLALWLPNTVVEKVSCTGNEEDSQCEKYRNLLVGAINKYMENPSTIPVHLIQEDDKRLPVAIPITVSRNDYNRLSILSNKTGLSKKKLGEVLICGEVL